jgi:hypothetical protein
LVIFEDCLADILTEKPQVKSSTSPWQVEYWKYLQANLSVIDLLYKMEMKIHTKENRWKVLHHYSLILMQSWNILILQNNYHMMFSSMSLANILTSLLFLLFIYLFWAYECYLTVTSICGVRFTSYKLFRKHNCQRF